MKYSGSKPLTKTASEHPSKMSPENPCRDCFLEQPRTHTNAGKKGITRSVAAIPEFQQLFPPQFAQRRSELGASGLAVWQAATNRREREVRQTRRIRSGYQPQESRTFHLPGAAGHGDCSNPTNGETAVVTRILFRWPSGRNGSDARE